MEQTHRWRNTLKETKGILLFCLMTVLCETVLAQAPVADFTSNKTSGCSPLTVNFTDLSSNSPTQWFWDFGNSNNSSNQNPSAVYTIPGTYTVTLTATNASGSDTEVKTAYITVFQKPAAAFSADTTYGCKPLTVQFFDQSTPGSGVISGWLWDFGDGNVSTLQNPTHQYVLAGGFTVSLTVYDDNGCQKTVLLSNYINLSAPATATITGGPVDTCVFPANISLADASVPGTSPIENWIWDFGDGSPVSNVQNPTHWYAAPGSYTITLIVSDSLNCPDTTVYVNYVNIIDFQADFVIDTLTACPNFVLIFYDSTSPAPVTWDWDFGDGNGSTSQNPLYFYDSAGTYDVTLVAENAFGCTDSVTQTINFNKPTAAFTVDTTRSCETPLTVNFTSTVSGTAPLTYYWNFDDGSPSSSVANPTHAYTSSGIFDPFLVVTDASGCTDTFRLSDVPDSIVVALPLANFSVDPANGGCLPLTAGFTDMSFSSVSSINSWTWNFDDPLSGGSNTSGLPNPTHTFDSAGVYSVTLTIGTDWGCTASVAVDVQVGIAPVLVDFAMSDSVICHGETVQFTDLSQDSINNWLWFFGDSNITSTLQNPFHTFMDTGSLVITLIAGHNGCNDTVQHMLVVVPPKTIFTVSPSVGCTVPHIATFNDFSIGADTWFWDFGDGFTSTDTNTTHTYTAPGSYTVKLLVTNANGCSDSSYSSVIIPSLQAGFTTGSTLGCFSLSVPIINTSTWLYTPAITFNYWVFGDGTTNGTSYNSNPTHVYNDTGSFTITLTITDFYGCNSTFSIPDYIQVNGVYPDLAAGDTAGCAPLAVNFTDLSAGNLPIDSWTWDFGDASPPDTTPNPSHSYPSPGLYTVTLTVADSNGCADVITFPDYITVRRPSPSFTYKPVLCIGEDIAISNSSSGDSLAYFWDFGDGFSDTAANPLHNYADTGVYTITLTVTDSNGCDSTLVNTVTVAPSSYAGIMVDTLNTNCPPLVVTFQDSSSADVISWFWSFGDGATSANQNPTHTYSYPDTFDVFLAVANATGCVDTLRLPGLIKIGGPYGSFTFTPDSGCVPLDVSFQAVGYNTSMYVWDYGDGVLDSLTFDTTSHTYLNEGSPHPALILMDSLGCEQPAQPPDPDSILIDDPVALSGSSTTMVYSTLCGLDTVFFYDSSYVLSPFTDIIAWNWDFGDGMTDTIQNPYHVYDDTGTYTISLQAVNSLGCIKYDSLVVVVKEDTLNILKASIPAFTDVLCGGDNTGDATGLAAGGTMPYTYLWSDDSAQTTIQSAGLVAGPYTFFVVDSNGCSDSATVLISEPPPLSVSVVDSGMVTCNGLTDGYAIAAASGGTGAYTYLWDDPGTQSGDSVGNLAADTFSVTVTDSMGCQAVDSVIITEPQVLIADSAGQANVICFGDSNGMAYATVSGGTEPYTYSWNTLPVETDTLIDSLPAGSYTITVLDSHSCSANYTFTVSQPSQLYALLVNTTAIRCYGDSTGEAWVKAFGGILPYTYSWSAIADGDTIADSLWADTFQYQVTDAAGCTYTDSVIMTQPPEIDITINVGDGSICRYGKDSLQAAATGGTAPLSYIWNNGLGTGQAWKPVTPDTTTTYQLSVIDANNCTAQDSLQIKVYELLKITVSSDTLCIGDSIGFQAAIVEGMDSSFTYIWNFGDGIVDSTMDTMITHMYSGTGTALPGLTVAGGDVCVTDSLSFDSVVILASPVATFSASPLSTTTFNPLIEFTDQSVESGVQGGELTSWYWDFGDETFSGLTDPDHYYADSGTFMITLAVSNGLGCTDTFRVSVRIDPSFEIEIPNAFTPDPSGPGGGVYDPQALDNDVFYPITRYVQEFHMMIFNRWGEMVFESFDLTVGWDGFYRGELSQQDVYVWKIDLKYINGTEFNGMGDLTLVR